MDGRLMLLCVVLVPCIGAFVLPFVGRISAGLRNLLALALAVVPLLLVVAILPTVVSAGPLNFTANINNIFNFTLYADGLAIFMALVSAFYKLNHHFLLIRLHQPLRKPERILPDGPAVPRRYAGPDFLSATSYSCIFSGKSRP